MTVALLSRAVGGLAPSSSSHLMYYGADEALLRRLKPSGPLIDASAGMSDLFGDRFRRYSSASPSLPTISMAFSPRGTTLATASSDDVGRVRLWDAASRRAMHSQHVVEVVR